MDIVQPPPLYPPLVSRPLNLDKNEEYDLLLNFKKDITTLFKESFNYVESCKKLGENEQENDFDLSIKRYSDRYSKSRKIDMNKWKPDWNRLPKELKYFYEKQDKSKLKKHKMSKEPNLVKRKIKKEIDIDKLVEQIAKEDEEENEEVEDEDKELKKEKTSDNEEENQEEGENEEEDIEEENDYIDTYFDNGENYGDDDFGGGGGGDDEGPVY